MNQRLHFIAIGGAVMHQLAIFLSQQGNKVSGSDDVIFDPALSQLKNHSLLPEEFGWNADHITKDIDAIILGMHAKADNPELAAAKSLGIPIFSFPEFIYERSKNKTRMVIAGSHGKTSITSMIMHILKVGGVDFDYLVGSRIDGFETMVRITEDAPLIILEGDEYLSSAIDSRSKFLHYAPDIAVISGIAWDHINVFPQFEEYLDTFRKFIQSISSDGRLFHYRNDVELNSLVEDCSCYCEGYEAFDSVEQDNQTMVDYNGKLYPVNVFGVHNMENLKAAALAVQSVGITFEECLSSLASYKGSAKRLERVHHDPDRQLDVYRDFAHAPSKLKASVAALRTKYPEHCLVAVFELHTYSSLQEDFLSHYADTMADADVKAVFLDAHALKIKGRPDINNKFIINSFNDDSITILRNAQELTEFMSKQTKARAVYAFMSSGNFDGFEFEL